MFEISQGDILQLENLKIPVLVVSKSFFNRTEQVIACPIWKTASPDPLHIPFKAEEMSGVVLCEQVKLLDLSVRGYKKISELRYEDIINIADAVQGIFDYYP